MRSLHCIEHINNAEHSIGDWCELFKFGSYIILVVPNVILYERKLWSTVFNVDHKWFFIMQGTPAALPKPQDITDLLNILLTSKPVSVEIMDHGSCHEAIIGYKKLVKISKATVSRIFYAAQFPIIRWKLSRFM